MRLLLGNDFESAALGFQLDHEPGGFHNVSPANTQLVAVILERATGMPYERYLDERVWRPAGAGRAAAARPARGHAGGPLLLARGGARYAAGREPARQRRDDVRRARSAGRLGAEMARPSRVSAGTGMQVQRSVIEGDARS